MPPVYLVAEVEVTDPVIFKQYLPLAAASVKKYGGEYLARGEKIEVIEGPPAKRMVITRFESAEAVKRWYESPEYAEAKVLRLASSNIRIVMIEGIADA
jgi:uncharacterized protein (DUF1330 family)